MFFDLFGSIRRPGSSKSYTKSHERLHADTETATSSSTTKTSKNFAMECSRHEAQPHIFAGASVRTKTMPATQERPSPSPSITVTPVPAQTPSLTTPSSGQPKGSSKSSSKSSTATGGHKAAAAGVTSEYKAKPLSSTQRMEQAILKTCIDTSEKLAVFAKSEAEKADSLRRTAVAMECIKTDAQSSKATQEALTKALEENSKNLQDVRKEVHALNLNVKAYLAPAISKAITTTANKMTKLVERNNKAISSSSSSDSSDEESEPTKTLAKKPHGSINRPSRAGETTEPSAKQNSGDEQAHSPSPPEPRSSRDREGSCSGLSVTATSIVTVDSAKAAALGDLRKELTEKLIATKYVKQPRTEPPRSKSTIREEHVERRSRTRSRSRSSRPKSSREGRDNSRAISRARSVAYLNDERDRAYGPRITIHQDGRGDSRWERQERGGRGSSRFHESRGRRERSRSDSRDYEDRQIYYKRRR